jgi:hypothetical protein
VNPPGLRWRTALGPVLGAVLIRPGLWAVALRTMGRLARPGWWHRWPLLPVPDVAYWHFRMVTAYGGAGEGPPVAGDVVAYLRWCRRMGQVCR